MHNSQKQMSFTRKNIRLNLRTVQTGLNRKQGVKTIYSIKLNESHGDYESFMISAVKRCVVK